jgi:hypothetical protein
VIVESEKDDESDGGEDFAVDPGELEIEQSRPKAQGTNMQKYKANSKRDAPHPRGKGITTQQQGSAQKKQLHVAASSEAQSAKLTTDSSVLHKVAVGEFESPVESSTNHEIGSFIPVSFGKKRNRNTFVTAAFANADSPEVPNADNTPLQPQTLQAQKSKTTKTVESVRKFQKSTLPENLLTKGEAKKSMHLYNRPMPVDYPLLLDQIFGHSPTPLNSRNPSPSPSNVSLLSEAMDTHTNNHSLKVYSMNKEVMEMAHSTQSPGNERLQWLESRGICLNLEGLKTYTLPPLKPIVTPAKLPMQLDSANSKKPE